MMQALKEEFIQNARLFIFETYCRIHQCIDIKMLSEKLNMGQVLPPKVNSVPANPDSSPNVTDLRYAQSMDGWSCGCFDLGVIHLAV